MFSLNDHFTEHVKPDLKVIRKGRRQLVTFRELERWAEDAGARTFE